MTSIMPLHNAHRKKSELIRAKVKMWLRPSAVRKREVEAISEKAMRDKPHYWREKKPAWHRVLS
jgi:hypothetical protein